METIRTNKKKKTKTHHNSMPFWHAIFLIDLLGSSGFIETLSRKKRHKSKFLWAANTNKNHDILFNVSKEKWKVIDKSWMNTNRQ